MDLSVVVPTYRRPGLLSRLLGSLGRQTLDPARFEAIVVDDHSEDATQRVLSEARAHLPNLQAHVQPENRGPAAARNRGVEESRAPLILFLDDDIEAPPPLVERHLRIHTERGEPSLGILGRVDWHPDLEVTPFMRWVDRSGLQFAYETWLTEGPVDPPYAAFYTANLSLRRDAILDAGGFDERFPYPAYEDMELAWRLTERGFRMEYRPDLLAYHTRAIDLPTFRRRMAKVAESAELLRHVRPGFPLDDAPILGGRPRRRDHLRLRLLAPVARLLGRRRVLDEFYRAEITAAYEHGAERGRIRVAGRG